MKKVAIIILVAVLGLGVLGTAMQLGTNLVFNGSVASVSIIVNLTNVAAVADTHGGSDSYRFCRRTRDFMHGSCCKPVSGCDRKQLPSYCKYWTVPAKVTTVQYTGVPSWLALLIMLRQ